MAQFINNSILLIADACNNVTDVESILGEKSLQKHLKFMKVEFSGIL